MVLKLIEKGWPLTHVIFYDTGMEFQAILNNWYKLSKYLEGLGIIPVYLKAEMPFWLEMLIKPTKKRDGSISYGYDWCGGVCRWRTSAKVQTINKYLETLDGDYTQYIGYAVDEPDRLDTKVSKIGNKVFPLVEWNMTEAECLAYCYEMGYNWLEGDIELYQILKRVSCWCCKNKNLVELRNMYHYLPKYWGYLKGLQSRIDRPFYGDQTIFDLEERFKAEDAGTWKRKVKTKDDKPKKIITTVSKVEKTIKTETQIEFVFDNGKLTWSEN